MKTKNRSRAVLISGVIIIFSTCLFSLFVFSACGRLKTNEAKLTDIEPPQLAPPPPKPITMTEGDTIWKTTEEIPMIKGANELLLNYISRNIKYPSSAAKNGIQGKVVVKISISSKGNVTDHVIVKSVSPELDAEALRVLKTITKFEPAWKDGKPISASYHIPITFRLQ